LKKEELIWQYSSEQRAIGSSMDNQRTAISNFVLTLTAGLVAVISIKGFSQNAQLLGWLIVILGVYGRSTFKRNQHETHRRSQRFVACKGWR